MLKSAVFTSYEIDDIDIAFEELSQGIEKNLKLKSNSIGFLFCQAEMDCAALSQKLHEHYKFDIIGGTTAAGATIDSNGFHELGITFLVLTADDCYFAAEMTENLAEEADVTGKINEMYAAALKKYQTKTQENNVKLIYTAMAHLPQITCDDCLTFLDSLAGKSPIFGFVSADDFEFCKYQTFLNGKAYKEAIAIAIIGGNLKPTFYVQTLPNTKDVETNRITKAKGNVIYEIENELAVEYIKKFKFIDIDRSLFNYQFFVEMKNDPYNDGVSISRVLNIIDKETGTISCFGNVPEDAVLSLNFCDAEDVKRSSAYAIQAIKNRIQNSNDYTYSTVLLHTCSLRNMYLSNQKTAEGDLILQNVLDGITYCGHYAFGEIAPTSIKNGKAVNRFHNATFTCCMF